MSKTWQGRIVIYRLGSLGDTVVALPCFNKIAECFPDSERIALTNIPVSPQAVPLEAVLSPGGFIHRSISYRVGTRNPVALFNLARELRALETETLIYLGSGRSQRSVLRDLVFFRACGFNRIIGAPVTHELNSGRINQIDGSLEREAERLARCLAPLGPIDIESPTAWNLRLTADENARASEVLQPINGERFLAINTGGKSASKDWGEPRWRELLARLTPSIPMPLVFVGAAEDVPRAESLGRLWRHPVLNCCGALNPRETAALLGQARCFIGHDSGPLHLAAAMGVPVVGLFGRDNRPRKWHPIGQHHRILHKIEGVEFISPSDVEAAIMEILDPTCLLGAPALIE